jgi:hypothetical protein
VPHYTQNMRTRAQYSHVVECGLGSATFRCARWWRSNKADRSLGDYDTKPGQTFNSWSHNEPLPSNKSEMLSQQPPKRRVNSLFLHSEYRYYLATKDWIKYDDREIGAEGWIHNNEPSTLSIPLSRNLRINVLFGTDATSTDFLRVDYFDEL